MEDASTDKHNMEVESAPASGYFPPAEPRVRVVLLGLLLSCLVFSMLGSALFQGIVQLAGWDSSIIYGMLAPDAPAFERWQMRLLLSFSQFFSFLLAGWVVLRFFYPPNRKALEYVKALKLPEIRPLFGGVAIILVSIPLVLYTYKLNQALPLPDSWRLWEEQTNDAIRGLLQMDSGLELLANLGLIAVLPALGEELIFRGIVQQQLMRRLAPWTALILTAAIFSFIHFQFEGFLPRMILGFLLGWLYWRTQNIWVPIAAHFVNNAVQVVGQFLYSRELSTIDLEQDVDVHWIAAAVSVILIVAYMWWIGQGKTSSLENNEVV